MSQPRTFSDVHILCITHDAEGSSDDALRHPPSPRAVQVVSREPFGGQYQTTGFGDQEPCGDEAEPRLGIDDGLLECCFGWSPSLQFLFLVEVYIEVSG